MKKTFTIIALALFTCLVGFLCWFNFSQNNLNPEFNKVGVLQEQDHGFVLQDYDVEMKVNDNNTIQVKEVVRVEFKKRRHGIYRNIPLTHVAQVQDGTKTKRIVQNIDIYNTSATKLVDKFEEGGEYVFQLGDADFLYDPGEIEDFTIKYTLNLGKDYIGSYDQLYYNVLGTGWRATIEHAMFKIDMPKEFDISRLQMFVGGEGSTNQYTAFSVSGNTISGEVSNLAPFNGLTVRLLLDEGYFENIKPVISSSAISIIPVLIAVALILTVIFFFCKNAHKRIVKPVEFYPPNKDNPVDMIGKLNGRVTPKDMVSLIVYFASKKYLSIETKDKDLILTRLVDTKNIKEPIEKRLMGELFELADTVAVPKNGYNKYRKDDIPYVRNSFSDELIKQSKKLSIVHKDSFDKKNKSFGRISLVFSCLAMLVYAIVGASVSKYSSSSFSSATWGGMLPFLQLIPFVLLAVNFKIRYERKTAFSQKAYAFAVTICGLLAMSSIYSYANLSFTAGWLNYVAMLLPAILLFGQFIPFFKNEKVKEIGEILGYRNFLEKCEKDRIEKLVEKNPDYFYDTLPYVYVFGLTKKFVSKFERLGYINSMDDGFYMHLMLLHYSFNSQITRTIASKMQSSGGRSGSFGGGGGGFSGGGFGGGGGGSW